MKENKFACNDCPLKQNCNASDAITGTLLDLLKYNSFLYLTFRCAYRDMVTPYASALEEDLNMSDILYSSVNPETKVYLIGRKLHERKEIPSELWYAILELKDKHLKELQVDWDEIN